MIKCNRRLKRAITRIFLSLIAPLLLTDMAAAKSGIKIKEKEVIINVSNGTPTLKAQIGDETYHFLVTPSGPGILISPEIAAKHGLIETSSDGVKMALDYAYYILRKNKLEIDFSGLKAKEYDVLWFHEKPYEGVDGTVGLSTFEGRDVIFVFDDGISRKTMAEKSYRNNTASVDDWRRNVRRFAGRKNMQLAFRPHYDLSRMTIGASYAFEEAGNLSFTGESYYMPREFRGYEEFIVGEFETPITPLKSVGSLSRAEVHVLEGSLDDNITGTDDVVATGKSTRAYTRILWLGRDYFEGCQSLVFSGTGKNLTTYCPEN